MIYISDETNNVYQCGSCESKRKVKNISVYKWNGEPNGGFWLCFNCSESLKDMLVDESEDDWE